MHAHGGPGSSYTTAGPTEDLERWAVMVEQGYDHRVVYQYYCRNLPRSTEPQYPLWQGLPAGSTMKPADVQARLQECTGIDSEPADRTTKQRRNLADILAVTRIAARRPFLATLATASLARGRAPAGSGTEEEP
ncbi:hypothetical protein AB0I81_38550 [Nonomuraea sp. NPDC050404]|uniref:hypothetical protein n=1 Tax=Nonomuraea sp. NPDC050404 TaxID=3155783 RepID=UPI003406CA91